MTRNSYQSFAIVPAAGASRRMGTHKLLLPFGEQTVIERVLASWLASRVDRVVVIVRPGDREVSEIGQRMGADVVAPGSTPAEMKDSVALGVAHIEESFSPVASDAWLLAPADMPRLDASVIDRLLETYHPDRPATLVPVSSGRRGHPVLLPWSRAAEVHTLPVGKGINSLIQAGQIVEVELQDAGIHDDLDTPEDYRRLR